MSPGSNFGAISRLSMSIRDRDHRGKVERRARMAGSVSGIGTGCSIVPGAVPLVVAHAEGGDTR